MENELIGGVAGSAPPPLQSLLVGVPAKVQLPPETEASRLFRIRAAESLRERRSASSLIERMYATRGYESAPLPADEPPHLKTFLATEHGAPIGTLTIATDRPDEGLLADSLFPEEVASFRACGMRICEFTKLAIDRRARSSRLLASLFHVAYLYAHRIKLLDHLLIEVNPRHVAYYQTMLGFEVIGPMRHNARVNAPAVLLALDLRHAEAQIGLFGGQPELAASERSAYPHFFSVKDEAGIVGRLKLADEDIAQVSETLTARAAARLAESALH